MGRRRVGDRGRGSRRRGASMPLIRVARLDELPAGQLTLVEAGGPRIVLAPVKDEVFAGNDVCAPHGGPLSEGKLSRARPARPPHPRVYDVRTGECGLPRPGCRPAPARRRRWGGGGRARAGGGGGGRPPPITTTRSPTKPRDTPNFPRVIRSDRRAPDSASGAPGSSSTPPSVVPASRYPLQ